MPVPALDDLPDYLDRGIITERLCRSIPALAEIIDVAPGPPPPPLAGLLRLLSPRVATTLAKLCANRLREEPPPHIAAAEAPLVPPDPRAWERTGSCLGAPTIWSRVKYSDIAEDGRGEKVDGKEACRKFYER